MKTCVSCGKEVPEDSQFCIECGAPQTLVKCAYCKRMFPTAEIHVLKGKEISLDKSVQNMVGELLLCPACYRQHSRKLTRSAVWSLIVAACSIITLIYLLTVAASVFKG